MAITGPPYERSLTYKKLRDVSIRIEKRKSAKILNFHQWLSFNFKFCCNGFLEKSKLSATKRQIPTWLVEKTYFTSKIPRAKRYCRSFYVFFLLDLYLPHFFQNSGILVSLEHGSLWNNFPNDCKAMAELDGWVDENRKTFFEISLRTGRMEAFYQNSDHNPRNFMPSLHR